MIGQELQRDRAAEHNVDSSEDGTHPAPTEPFNNPVLPHHFATDFGRIGLAYACCTPVIAEHDAVVLHVAATGCRIDVEPLAGSSHVVEAGRLAGAGRVVGAGHVVGTGHVFRTGRVDDTRHQIPKTTKSTQEILAFRDGICFKQGLQIAAKHIISFTGRSQKRRSLVTCTPERLLKKAFEKVKGLRTHDSASIFGPVPGSRRDDHASSSRFNHARAIRQSFDTVPCEIPSASAVSSMLIPAK